MNALILLRGRGVSIWAVVVAVSILALTSCGSSQTVRESRVPSRSLHSGASVAFADAVIPDITIEAPAPAATPDRRLATLREIAEQSFENVDKRRHMVELLRWQSLYPDKLRSLGVQITSWALNAAAHGPIIVVEQGTLNSRSGSLIESSFQQANPGSTVWVASLPRG
jgi:hypothetical protein